MRHVQQRNPSLKSVSALHLAETCASMVPLQDHRFIPKPRVPLHFPALNLRTVLPIHISIQNPRSFSLFPPPPAPIRRPTHPSTQKTRTLFRIHVSARKTSPSLARPASILHFGKKMASFIPDLDDRSSSTLKASPFSIIPSLFHKFALVSAGSLPLPAHAAEAEQVVQKINIEQILISIDDFFNRNPFFVAGVTVIWLVVIPLTEEYLKKCKLIGAIDAFRKLRDLPNAQLLDVRKRQSVKFMAPPNLKIFNKNVVQVEYTEGNDDGFVKEVLQNFPDPQNTIICVLDNFDGDSLKLAELLYKNGFREAYAIKGGLRGKNGWQDIQEKFLPPSVHVRPRKRSKASSQSKVNNQIMSEQLEENDSTLPSPSDHKEKLSAENGSINPVETISAAKTKLERPLSPYPNYPELKPPSSPSPSKPSS